MRRTELLQKVRKMRFEDAYRGWRKGRLTQSEAAELLGVCDRTFRRYLSRYEDEGIDGLMDKRLTQGVFGLDPPNHYYHRFSRGFNRHVDIRFLDPRGEAQRNFKSRFTCSSQDNVDGILCQSTALRIGL